MQNHSISAPPPHLLPTTTTTTTTTAVATLPYIFIATTLFSFLLLFTFFNNPISPKLSPHLNPSLFPPSSSHRLLFRSPTASTNSNYPITPPLPPPPSIAYLISGSSNDTDRILRLLYSIYHPKNTYLLHLDSIASHSERDALAIAVQSVPLFKAAQNVDVIGKADIVYPTGSSPISALLHGASILLHISKNWDWFINLSVDHYPLVTQDDLLHILSYLPKDMNFVNHTSYIGWIESRNLRPIIVDPGLYIVEENEVFSATQKRLLPDAFRLFTGSSSGILSRSFVEFCILGTENLPRTMLMYLANTPFAASVYFPTILCNSKQFNTTTVNHSLQYVNYNFRKEPIPLNSTHFDVLVRSGAAFASPFLPNDPLLDRIDRELLQRHPGKPVPGGWCLGGESDCNVWGDADVLRPGFGSKRLEKRLLQLLGDETLRSRQCIYD